MALNNQKQQPIPVVPRQMQIVNPDGTPTRSGQLLLQQLSSPMVSFGAPGDMAKTTGLPDGALYVQQFGGITAGGGEALYQLEGGEWHYVSGTAWGTLSPDQRPVGLGPNDAGFTFRTIDTNPQYSARTFVWSGSEWVETTDARFGTHAARLSTGNLENGALWIETDRSEVLYQLQGNAWHYVAGTMWGTVVPDQRPTDLGPNDAGFHFRGTDQAREWIWSGTIWVEVGTSNYDVNGALIGTRSTLNLIAGSNVTLSGVDNSASNRVDVTVSSSGGGTGGAVSSVFGRTGAVVAQTGDYTAAQVGAVATTTQVIAGSGLSGGGALSANVTLSAVALGASGTGHSAGIAPDPGATAGSTRFLCENATWTTTPAAPVSSVFGRTGAVVAASGDYSSFYVPVARQVIAGTGMTGGGALSADVTLTAKAMGASGASHSVGIVPDPGATAGTTRFLREDATWTALTAAMVTNAVDSTATYANPAWITSLAWSKITGAPAAVVPGGANTNVQFNSSGAFGGSSNLAWDNTNVRLGIGTASPGQTLTVLSGTQLAATFGNASGAVGLGQTGTPIIQGYTSTAAGATANLILQVSGGNVGIGVTPTHQLQLSSDDALKTTTNTWATPSGLGVKQNVRNLDGGLNVINQLRPIEAEHNGKHDTRKGQRIVSVIAEEVRKVLPGTVRDMDGVLYFNPHEVIFHMILAIQELSRKNEELEAKLKNER